MRKRLKYPLLLFLVLLAIQGRSQSVDSLALLIKKIQKGENDSVRVEANRQFRLGFEKLLKEEGSFSTNFDSLKNVSVIVPEDSALRLYTWILPHFDGNSYDYFGFIQYKPLKDKDSIVLLPLCDSTDYILKPESEKLSPNRWLGAVYYGIRTTVKAKTTYYTLFGWKGKNQNETQKIIEVLLFNKNKPQFGFPLFKTESVFKSRMIFTFAAISSMALNYDKNFGGIVFDHIAGNKKDPSVLSGPDGTYDAFKWKKGKWLLYRDVDIRGQKMNDKNP